MLWRSLLLLFWVKGRSVQMARWMVVSVALQDMADVIDYLKTLNGDDHNEE